MKVIKDSLSGTQIANLLSEHLANMAEISPRESVHALDLEKLRAPEITFWTAWNGEELLGCGALREIDATHGEIKSMRTVALHRRKGVAAAVLEQIFSEAKLRNYQRLSLETGSMPPFKPAQELYVRFGFVQCGPFAEYAEDPYSIFMTRKL